MSPKEPDLGQGCPPSAGLTLQSTALFLPDLGGWCRLACNLLTVPWPPSEKAGIHPSSPLAWAAPNPQPEPVQRALPFSTWAGPHTYADQEVSGPTTSLQWSGGPERVDRTRKPYCAPHTGQPHKHPGWGLRQIEGSPFHIGQGSLDTLPRGPVRLTSR